MSNIVKIAPIRRTRHEVARAHSFMRLRTLFGEMAAEHGEAEAVAMVLRFLELETGPRTYPARPAMRQVCQTLAAKF